MNAKTAKRLRKIALGLVVAAEQKNGKPIERVSYVTKGRPASSLSHAGTVYVASNTYKGAYKALKKGVRNGSIGQNSLTSV